MKGVNYQKTNSIWHTDEFVKRGLKWGDARLKSAKEFLKEHNLVEEFQVKDENGKFGKKFIKVGYVWKQETKKELLNQHFSRDPQNGQTGKHGGGLQGTNALSNININALSNINEMLSTKKTKKNTLNAEETQEHIEILNHYASLFSPHRPVKDKTWHKNATHWLKTYSLEEIKEAITNWYKYPHWSKEGSSKNGLAFLFRIKNKNGEANYIEEMLQLGGGVQVPDKKKLASLKFEEMWKDVI